MSRMPNLFFIMAALLFGITPAYIVYESTVALLVQLYD